MRKGNNNYVTRKIKYVEMFARSGAEIEHAS